jgi:hypothetical protein
VKGKIQTSISFEMVELKTTDAPTIVSVLMRLIQSAKNDHGMTVIAFETDNASNFTAALAGMAKEGSLSQPWACRSDLKEQIRNTQLAVQDPGPSRGGCVRGDPPAAGRGRALGATVSRGRW